MRKVFWALLVLVLVGCSQPQVTQAQCHDEGHSCDSDADCCAGYYCSGDVESGFGMCMPIPAGPTPTSVVSLPTPTATATRAPSPTPGITTTVSSGKLAVVVSDGTREECWRTLLTNPEIALVNIGAFPMTVRLTPGIQETTPATPTATDLEYILAPARSLLLPSGTSQFCYRAGNAQGTALSISVRN